MLAIDVLGTRIKMKESIGSARIETERKAEIGEEGVNPLHDFLHFSNANCS